ncbi:MAG: glycosyltransferase family 39 protein [Candidatus Coatesbacteria bacterium]|nr:glycosyltransferase family 39 protein [Candidatus Coatesbacteria bacterium]
MESYDGNRGNCCCNSSKWILVAIIGIAAGVFLSGIRKDLPYSHEIDENIYVDLAVKMVSTGDMNPRWFGNPGSTVIYPLVFLFKLWTAGEYGGGLIGANPIIVHAYAADQTEYYILGRMLTVLYALLSILMTYLVGKRLFGERVALIGAFFSTISPLIVYYGQVVRTDLAGTFFTMLSLWLILRIYDAPSTKNQVLAGLAIGSAIATRYFMVILCPALVAVDVMLFRMRRGESNAGKVNLRSMAAGLLAVPISFVLWSPFFVLDLPRAIRSIIYEARPSHFGHDGLSFFGNLAWYLTKSIPANLTLPIAILTVAGLVLVFLRRRPEQLLIVSFAVLLLLCTSLSKLHWSRWTIQLFPTMALLAAYALCETLAYLVDRASFVRRRTGAALTVLIVVFSILLVHDLLLFTIGETATSTRILAREWVIRNLPDGAKVAYETYSVNLDATSEYFELFGPTMLAARGSLREFYNAGFEYLVVTSSIYDRFLAQPDRYPCEASFYSTLFEKGYLVKEFKPSDLNRGPTVRIYRIRGPADRTTE